MTRSPSRRMVLALIPAISMGLAGCGVEPAAVESSQREPAAKPVEVPQATLRELLDKPRGELARLFQETLEQVQIRERAHRDGTLSFGLLPRLRLPLILPVWNEASFSSKSELSLPPYCAEGTRDNHLALHLARFGDAEAARKLAESADQSISNKIDALAAERNYPAEWTRLVALMLHTAEYRLAMGEDAGRAELASLHTQLRELLDAKTAGGPLGAALLRQGHKTLCLAASAWREQGQPALADKADADLAAWGEVPALAPAVPLGATTSAVADLLRSQVRGHVVVALSTDRALDLFALPVTSEGAQSVISCFNAADKLTEVLVCYRPRIADYYLEPANVALPLEDHEVASKERPQISGVHIRDYTLANLTCEVDVVSQGYLLGALVRFASPKPGRLPSLTRDFGVVNLDRSFGQNRVRLVPELIGDVVRTQRPAALEKATNPLAPLRPVEAELSRAGLFDVVSSFSLAYEVEEEKSPLFQTAVPLLAAYGPARIEPREDKNGGHLEWTWEDELTRYSLQLPHVSGRRFLFEVSDRRGPEKGPERVAAAAEFDRKEREERLRVRKPLARIPRRLEVGWSGNFVQLGMTKEQVLASLPRGQSILKLNAPSMLHVVLTGDPPHAFHRVLREAFIRFGPDDKVAELRVRYVDGPSSTGTSRWTHELLASLTKPCGAPFDGPGPWASIWSDLPARKPAASLDRWQDDITLMTFQRDSSGAEITLRDCPLAQPQGIALPPLAYLPRGLEGCQVGQSRADLLQAYKIEKPTIVADGALVLPARGNNYDAVLVWFDKDKVSRIVARHVRPSGPAAKLSPGDLVMQTWARSLRSLGWPQREDVAGEKTIQSLGWFDDQVRIRIFWQESDEGPPRIFTEWKDLASAPKP